MRNAANSFLKISAGAVLIGALLIGGFHLLVPDFKVLVDAVSTQTAQVAAAQNQATDGSSITITLDAHDVSALKDLFVWVRANFTNSEIRQAMLDAYMFICAERPGGQPQKPSEPPIINPTPCVDCTIIGNPNDNSTHP